MFALAIEKPRILVQCGRANCSKLSAIIFHSVCYVLAGFVLNVNAGPKDLTIPDKITINDLTPEELKKFIDKVVQASDEDESIANYDDRPVDCKQHSALKDELNRTDVSEVGFLKHARQQVWRLWVIVWRLWIIVWRRM